MNFEPGVFKRLDANPSGTLELFNKYTERMSFAFRLALRKAGIPYELFNQEKKAMLLFQGGDDMKDLFQHVVLLEQKMHMKKYSQRSVPASRTAQIGVVQWNLLLANFPQGTKSFGKWSKEVSNAAKLIDFTDYDWKREAVDAMILQKSSPKLRVSSSRKFKSMINSSS